MVVDVSVDVLQINGDSIGWLASATWVFRASSVLWSLSQTCSRIFRSSASWSPSADSELLISSTLSLSVELCQQLTGYKCWSALVWKKRLPPAPWQKKGWGRVRARVIFSGWGHWYAEVIACIFPFISAYFWKGDAGEKEAYRDWMLNSLSRSRCNGGTVK